MVPGERQPVLDGRPPHHVGRLRPLGEHVLRLADRAGRRGPGGGDGRAAGHRVPRADADAADGPLRRARAGGRSPWAWPPPPRSTWPTRTPRWRPRGPGARRCRCVSITDAAGRPVAAGTAGLPAGARHRRGPGGRRRGPLPGRRPVDVRALRRRHRRRSCAPRLGRPVAGKTGSSERNETETVVAFTPQLAVAAIAANPDDPRDAVGRRVQARMVDRGGRRCSPSRCATSRYATSSRPAKRSPSSYTGPRTGN